jgi:hypothetical protein
MRGKVNGSYEMTSGNPAAQDNTPLVTGENATV